MATNTHKKTIQPLTKEDFEAHGFVDAFSSDIRWDFIKGKHGDKHTQCIKYYPKKQILNMFYTHYYTI